MPYIAAEKRIPYSAILSRFLEVADYPAFVAFVLDLLEAVYGRRQTRYYLQNECIGVLQAAALEYQRRRAARAARQVPIKPQPAACHQELLEALLAVLPREDASERPGHLNYLLSELSTQMQQRGDFPEGVEPHDLLRSLAEHWYQVVTAPYEDQAIAKAGDIDAYRAFKTGNAQ